MRRVKAVTLNQDPAEFDVNARLVQLDPEMALASRLGEIAKRTVTLPVNAPADLRAFLDEAFTSERQNNEEQRIDVDWVDQHFGSHFPIMTWDKFTDLLLSAIKVIHILALKRHFL
jgi:hypothetical protein